MKLKKIIENVNNNAIFLIASVYFPAFGLIVFNRGIFFDDWVFYNIDKTIFMSFAKEYGMPWIGWYNIFLNQLFNNITLNRTIVFCCYLFSAFCLYGILKTIREIPEKDKLLITILFALFPINFARILFCTSHYAISYFLFFLGFFLLSRYFIKRNIFLRIMSLVLFYMSFITNSLLVYYAIVLFYIMYAENTKRVRDLINVIVKYMDFFVLPSVFWVMKVSFFKPHGLYADYNIITLQNIIRSPLLALVSFKTSLVDPLDFSTRLIFSRPILILAGSFIVFLLLKNKIMDFPANKRDRSFMVLGIILFLLGIFPYLCVGQLPVIDDWGSRHQLLIPLGASFILYYGLNLFSNALGLMSKMRIFLNSIFIALFIAANFLGYLEYQKDWFKQLSLIENFKENEILRNNTSFTFDDNTAMLNAKKRSYRFYEYTGLMKYAFGDERRFGTSYPIDFTTVKKYRDYGYNMRQFDMQKPQYKIVINYGEKRLTDLSALKMLLLEILKPEEFRSSIKKLLQLECVRL